MKKEIFVLALLGLLLASCASSGEADITPTTPPTKTPPPLPTSTPSPTATPTPRPTPTPTPEPTQPPLDVIIQEQGMDELAVLREAELFEYLGGYYRWSIGLSNVMIDTWVDDHPTMYVTRAEANMRLGNIEKAIQDLEIAAQLPYVDDASTNLSINNNLCWYLGITGEGEKALPYCEKAVPLAEATEFKGNPTVTYVDSRGLVYGLLGRTEEAIADFERVLTWAEENPGGLPAEMVASRQEWLASLEKGEDPFTPEVLEELRLEGIDPLAYPEPEMLEDYSRQHFVNVLEQDGFMLVDSGVNDNDVEYQFYGVMAGECGIGVIVFGPENEISEAKMMLIDCAKEQYIPEMRWFAKLLLLNNPREDVDCIQMGEWFAWELTELQQLVDGEIKETDEFSIGALDFYALEEEIENGTRITIYGY